jgi:hypothetical protein
MHWSPNPLALARTVMGGANGGRGWPRSKAEAEALLGDAFGANADAVFYGTPARPALLDLLRQVAIDVPKRRPMREIVALPSVAALSKRLHAGAIERILPFLAPVADIEYPPGIRYGDKPAAPIAAYRRVGALDVGGVSWLDPEQGNLGDCYLVASMCSLAWARPWTWYERLSRATQGTKTPNALLVQLHGELPGDHNPRSFEVPPRVPLDIGGHFIYAHSAAHHETWPALVERAYVAHVVPHVAPEPTARDYQVIGADRKWPEDAARILVGARSNARFGNGHHGLSAELAEICDGALVRYPTMASTHEKRERRDWDRAKVVPNHAYSVLGRTSHRGRGYVILRDPYGTNAHAPHTRIGAWAEGAPRNGGEPVTLDEHGVFACDRDRFDRYFTAFGWVELPPDPA